jgi:predicted metal-dependent hydrolase
MKIPKPRAVRFDFTNVPKHWFGGNVVATHIANGVNLLFPAGERFFVRSVHRYLDRIDDPILGERVRGFAGQEGRHANAHERYFDSLRAQGYDIDTFLNVYEAIAYGFLEKTFGPKMRLATTVACEHFTAILAEYALEKRLLDFADPTMRDLLLWHAAEEIEHRSVAFDVLQSVDSGYALRAAGMAMASVCLGSFWVAATLSLLAQEREISGAQKMKHWKVARAQRGDGSVFRRGIRDFLRPGFHPDRNPVDRVAAEYLEAAGIA